MDFELFFSLAGVLAMLGWALLLLSPLIPNWSDRVAGLAIPALLSVSYVALMILQGKPSAGGFGSLAEVAALFEQPGALLAGWVHFLTFDLLVGAWICRAARLEGVRFWLIVPCLPLTFMFGPAGWLLFQIIRRLGHGNTVRV